MNLDHVWRLKDTVELEIGGAQPGLTFRIELYEKPNRRRFRVMRYDLFRITPTAFRNEHADEEILVVDAMFDGIELDGNASQAWTELIGRMNAQFGTAPQRDA